MVTYFFTELTIGYTISYQSTSHQEEELSQRNAALFLWDPHRIIVTGPRRLRGRTLASRDLRSGMDLIAAALAADGVSRVHPLETVARGYAQLVERLKALGAAVEVEA